MLKKSRAKRARTALPPQCKICGGTEFREGDLALPGEPPMPSWGARVATSPEHLSEHGHHRPLLAAGAWCEVVRRDGAAR